MRYKGGDVSLAIFFVLDLERLVVTGRFVRVAISFETGFLNKWTSWRWANECLCKMVLNSCSNVASRPCLHITHGES